MGWELGLCGAPPLNVAAACSGSSQRPINFAWYSAGLVGSLVNCNIYPGVARHVALIFPDEARVVWASSFARGCAGQQVAGGHR